MIVSKRSLVLASLTAAIGLSASAATLTLNEYMDQVRGKNMSFKASEASRDGGKLRKDEGDMETSWSLFSNLTFVSDSKLPMSIITPYDTMINHNYQVGINKQWNFGLNTRLSYNWTATTYVNAQQLIAGVYAIPMFNAYSMLELTLPLLGHGFGVSTRAKQTAAEATALASSYGASFQAKSISSGAEATYWRLSVARRLVKLSRETLERTQKISEWNARRAQMQLADRADALQSAAGLQQAKLSVQSAEDEVRNASRAFNSARNLEQQEVTEDLEDFDASVIDRLTAPKRVEKRDDVKSAEQSMRATRANLKLAIEKNWPTLDVFSNIVLNGQPAGTPTAASYPQNFPDSMKNSIAFNRPAYTVGLRLNVPLYFLTANDTRKGYFMEQQAAEMTYERKVFEQDQAWQELTANFTQAKKKLEIARTLEAIQREKLEHERLRYDRGRTTTFQLLSFENDYLSSQLQRIQSEFGVITLAAQLKLFAEDATDTQDKI